MRKSVYADLHLLLTKLLRDARLEAGLTQQELVRRHDRRHQSFVAKYEAAIDGWTLSSFLRWRVR